MMTNSRSLYGSDLANLFTLTAKHSSAKYDTMLMNVASNLRTLGVNLLKVSEQTPDFYKLNIAELEKERALKQMILDIYKQIYARQPALFGSEHSYSLSPLSSLMAELFDSFQH